MRWWDFGGGRAEIVDMIAGRVLDEEMRKLSGDLMSGSSAGSRV